MLQTQTATRSMSQCFSVGTSAHVLNATKYKIIANVWRMMKLRSPGRSVLDGLTESTWDSHRRWIMDSKRFGMELEVSPGVMRAPGWQLCLSYQQKVRESAMNLIRLQGLPLAAAVDRVRNDQENRMIHWVQLLMQLGQQRSVSAAASSSGSSSSAKLYKGSQPGSQSSEVKAPANKVDKLAFTVKLLADRSLTCGKGRDRSRSPRQLNGNQKKGKGKGKDSVPFAELMKQHEAKFTLKRGDQEICFKFQDDKCQDRGCVRAHVCAGCGRNTPWIKCTCINLDWSGCVPSLA